MTFQSIIPKDIDNIVFGNSTYGIWEYISYFDELVFDMWMYAATPMGMGFGMGLIVTSILTKSVFVPFIIYGVSGAHRRMTFVFSKMLA